MKAHSILQAIPTLLLLPSLQHLLHQDLSRHSHQPSSLLSRHLQPRQEATPLARPTYEFWIAKHPRLPLPVNSEPQRQALRRGLSFDNLKRALGWGKKITLCVRHVVAYSAKHQTQTSFYLLFIAPFASLFFLRRPNFLVFITLLLCQSEHEHHAGPTYRVCW